ncbi:hypothetical protein [Parafrankia elaeagni]|uniref:hypothetical protein n=1 Tax=Parafrankia elaeagni TaxID=222534 RepID=UPI0003665AAB|nr:hypothetical protein [Parafrankia elaeagni]
MPPVALTTATAAAFTVQTTPQPADVPTDGGVSLALAARPVLRLVGSEPVDPSGEAQEIVHGFGGPSTCSCRPCAMARHPSFMPRLRAVD